MALTYDPYAYVQPNTTWDTTFLSDRDVSAQVPINFVPHPGVYLTAACFGNGIYDDLPAQNCLSNLLASQIRRYVIDLYWSVLNKRFILCPSELPIPTTTLSPSANIPQYTALFPKGIARTSSHVSRRATGTLHQLGPYECSDTLGLDDLVDIYDSYQLNTSDTLEAKFVTIILNLRVANALNSSTAGSPLHGSSLPTNSELVTNFFDSVDSVIYKPGTLLSERQNINSSWLRRADENQKPNLKYYTLVTTDSGNLATPDGWPDESYIQDVHGKRLLLGFGTVDSSFEAYNTSLDGGRIFPPGYLENSPGVSISTDGTLSSGCFYRDNVFSVSALNNSWATAPIVTDISALGNIADNLTTCGYTQMLNSTINNQTADVNPIPYQNFGNNAVFSWAYGQPQNDSVAMASLASRFRCALMVSNDTYQSHWRVDYCSSKYRVACRQAGQPYLWSISSYNVDFSSAEAACTGNTTFDVPRTGLENRYLWHRVIADSRSDPTLLNGIWINFNSLRVENCWITSGVNGSCPYYQNPDAVDTRQILIPTVAALIVLILTVMTILVKCSSNARNSRKVRRGDGGWDYEGIPS